MLRALRTASVAILQGILLLFLASLLTRSDAPPPDRLERIRAYTRADEFNYVDWMLDALLLKNAQTALNPARYLDLNGQRDAVLRYLDLVRRINQLNGAIAEVYADPSVSDPFAATTGNRAALVKASELESRLGPLAESVIQAQVSYILEEMGLTTGGQPVPPVLYRVTPLPYALIVSPRDAIHQDANVSLLPGISLEERVAIEESVEGDLDLSALVVAIGGVGVYPTMVQSSTDIVWLTETVAHEWTHNYLTLRPLGIRYDLTPELRTINETTANIAGREIGRALLQRFYPELAPPPEPEPEPEEPPSETQPEPTEPEEPLAFDFRREMRITRVEVDRLLSEGKIEEAEAYMEARRAFFWEHGHQIRKLNQAYFAFYGAYDDVPGGGAAGEDPVGPAVRALRSQSPSLAAFLNIIAQVTSFEELQTLVVSE